MITPKSVLHLFVVFLAVLPSVVDAQRTAFERNAWLGRGINIGNALEAPNEGDWSVTLQAEYFQIVADAGFNSVRIPVRWQTHVGAAPNYTINETFFQRVDWAIDQALSNGLAIVINAHHYDELLDNVDLKDKLVTIWTQIADRYKNYSDSLFFEILNEPHVDIDGVFLNQVHAEAIEAIRQTNPDRTILVTTSGMGNLYDLWRIELPEGEKNVIATIHYYTPFQFTHQGGSWVEGADAWLGTQWDGTDEEKQLTIDEMAIAAQWSQDNQIPVNLGEFGAYEAADYDDRVAWTEHIVKTVESYGFSWAYWEFCAGFGAYSLDSNEWKTGLYQALMPTTPIGPSGLFYDNASAIYTTGEAIVPNTAEVTGLVDLFSVDPSLPTGLDFDPATGTISGTPQVASPATDYTITASNDGGSISIKVSIEIVNPCTPLVSVREPTALSAYEGESVTLDYQVSGTPPITFRWQKDGVDIPGETDSLLVFDSVVIEDQATYTCVATNCGGDLVSSQASLEILTELSITKGPASQTVCVGDSVALKITATGELPITYQWRKDGVVITGQADSVFTIAAVVPGDSGAYACSVSNDRGGLLSAEAVLTILEPVTITQQPESLSVYAGDTATFTIGASGGPPITYQWYKDSVAIAGQTDSVLTVSPVTAADSGVYACAAANAGKSSLSSGAALTVMEPVSIMRQPVSVDLYAGLDATFSVTATGEPPISFQWYKDSTAIAGQIDSVLAIDSVAASDTGAYTCSATNGGATVLSAQALLRLLESVTITLQPVSVGLRIGDTATFAVAATGEPSIAYQWYKDSIEIAGQTDSVLTIGSVTASDTGAYTCLATNGGGSILSDKASLTLLKPLAIVRQPLPQDLQTGDTAIFSVFATGEAPITYRWYKDRVGITGKTDSVLMVANVSMDDAGLYMCVIANESGVVQSNSVMLTVFPGTSIHGRIGGQLLGSPPVTVQLRQSPRGLSLTLNLGKSGQAIVRIYSSRGNLVKELTNSFYSAGTHRFQWDCLNRGERRITGGWYVLWVDLDGSRLIRPITLLW